MASPRERLLGGCVLILLAVSAGLILLLRETWGGYPDYDDKIIALTRKANAGSVSAAGEAWGNCAMLPAEQDRAAVYDVVYDTIGICSNFKYLYIENAIATGDPVILREAMQFLADSEYPGFAERLRSYKDMARPFVRARCGAPDPPKGCSDPSAMVWLDKPAPLP